MSSPTDRPNAMASLVAASAVADRKLLASFIAWARPGAVAHPVAAVAQPGEHRLDVGAGVVRRRRTSPRACGPARRQRRPTPARRRRRRRPRRAAPRSPARRARRSSRCRPRAWCRRSATARISPVDLFGRRAVGQAQHDDVGAPRDLGHGAHVRGARGRALRAERVVRDDREAGLHEVRGQDAAHVAEADESDACPSSRVADRAQARTRLDRSRRAATPAGAPQ